ncbi:glutathione hydrolase 7-like isoform X2 [Anarrhichthys ocellatus]|uniref:glutathione hydrolase 7-like isoform X2 n=1 Tax=Anarrhichthys ocellatus TaxID=433405 RepID=UPI0012ED8884|nr:glutathione hydrolase 7-like isoform X2 [Anarrhichthys ocellatus]
MKMEVSPETKLNKQLIFSYNSFAGSSELADGSSDFTCDLNKNDLSHLPKDVPLKQLASGSPNVLDCSLSDLKETDKDRSSQDTAICVYAVSITFAIGVTFALILHIYLGVFVKGVVVSDRERCTALGQTVLRDRGSSVDAAITATLCLGVVHPHVSGVGGGGLMLVHDIQRNETRVINFQGTAPTALKEEMLQSVSELKAGLQVGVPGLLRGLQHAHSLYGRLSWEDVVTRAAAVAKEGFNVSLSLAEAILKVKGERLSQRFRDTFMPGGRALIPGSFLRSSSLAGVLEAGLPNFYDGNFSRELEDEVRRNGGVLSREDISNYSVQVEQPVEGLYNEFIIQVPPPPSTGAALISALNLLEGLQLNGNNNTGNQTQHWIAEALKGALAIASGLGDPSSNSSVTERLSDMLSMSQAEMLRQRINSSHTSPPEYHSLRTEPMAGQVVVVGPDGLIVSIASSLSTPFGSRIMTGSGVILNSLILDFSWPIKTSGRRLTNQNNRVQPGKRPQTSLMPTIVVPAQHKCGIYMALSGSGGQQGLSVITQVLISALSFHKEKNESLSPKGLLPNRQPNRRLVDPEFPEERVRFEKGRTVTRVKTNSVVQGILRNKDIITAITPQLSDLLLQFS